MAINSNEILQDQNPDGSISSSKISNLSSCRSNKSNVTTRDSSIRKSSDKTKKIKEIKSPYLVSDKIQVLSRVTDKKMIHEKPINFLSSFPLAASVYKCNSDEFKRAKRGNRKFKKSVLTLPNEPAPMPKIYTVSDLNDSEYFNDINDGRSNKQKERRIMKRNKKPLKTCVKDRVMEYFDRDARYCSQLNIDLDCSSSEIVNFNGDGQKISKRSYKSYEPVKAGNDPHDVWSVLRNINKQFRPSPPSSQESKVPSRKRKPLVRRGSNRTDTRIIETCHTEEFAYISSFEIDSKSRDSCSLSSSFDRVTVIDKQSEKDEIMQHIFKSHLNFRNKHNVGKKNGDKNKPRLQINNKVPQSNKEIVSNNIHKNVLQQEHKNAHAINNNCVVPKHETVGTQNSDISINSVSCQNLYRSIRGINLSPNNLDVDRFEDNKICYKGLVRNANSKINVAKVIDDSEKQLNGITKVVLSKGQAMVTSKLDPPRKPRLALTLPKNNLPNFTTLEIKRRLAKLKFPIVILEKDQLTNQGILVVNNEPPQFNGLDQQIWPFMLNWSKPLTQKIEDNAKKEVKIKQKYSKVKHKDNNFNLFNNNNTKNKANERAFNRNSNFEAVHELVNDASSLNLVPRPKPITLLKNKMLQFLQKRSDSPLKRSNKDAPVCTGKTTKNGINQKGYVLPICAPPNEVTKMPFQMKLSKYMNSTPTHTGAKAKRASDFIENIIKKIRSGVYYGVDQKEIKYRINGTEVSTQTEASILRNAWCQNTIETEVNLKELSKIEDPLKNIPEFDQSLTTVRIERIDASQIAVKHCVTNVVVQFDIKVDADAKNLIIEKNLASCIPICLKDTQEKIFKYDASIHNAILPAELCSIIPTMMRTLLEVDKKVCCPVAAVQKVTSNIMIVSKNHDTRIIPHTILPALSISNHIQPLVKGGFSQTNSMPSLRKNLCLLTDTLYNAIKSFLVANPQLLQYTHQLPLCDTKNNSILCKDVEKPNRGTNRLSECMALLPYDARNLSVIPSFGIFNSTDFIKQIIDKFKVNVLLQTRFLNHDHIFDNEDNNMLTDKLIYPNFLRTQSNATPFSYDNNFGIISLFPTFSNSSRANFEISDSTLDFTSQALIDRNEKTLPSSDKKESKLRKQGRKIRVSTKNSFIKCYRKCKSMSNISSNQYTPLNKITDLDDFCQTLGSSSLSKVLDGCTGKKILAAVRELSVERNESVGCLLFDTRHLFIDWCWMCLHCRHAGIPNATMETWIKEITQKQALLILLLTNKKDTPNLIRFKPVLLQGIAVNRITRAVELDTEIEVIERENFNKLSHVFEGISYLPASSKNQDNLFEELYWIAKTTASDYQKKFDESSEKLLKSLLEKRKKLNPSYLRVMARYVGLGLLTPLK